MAEKRTDLVKVEEKLMLQARQMIRDAMGLAGVNQKELARRMGITEGRVSQLLNSSRNITIKTLVSMLFACGVTMRIDVRKRSRGKTGGR